jgi:hypothetical protein
MISWDRARVSLRSCRALSQCGCDRALPSANDGLIRPIIDRCFSAYEMRSEMIASVELRALLEVSVLRVKRWAMFCIVAASNAFRPAANRLG